MPARLDIVHAALTGFRLTRSRPLLVAVAALLFFVSGFINMAATAVYAGPEWSAFWNAAFKGANLETLYNLRAALTPHLWPAVIICLPVTLGSASLFLAAVWRGVLAPEQGGFGNFRLGIDELRQLMVLLLQYLFFVLATVVIGIVLGLVSALVASASPQFGALLFLILGCAAMALMVIAGAHLSLAGPATFERRKVQVLSAWPLADHLFWPIAAAYVLAALLSLLVLWLGTTISYAPLILVSGGVEAASKQVYVLSVQNLLSPLSLVSAVLAAIFQALTAIITVAPAADLYRQIANQTEA